jgi:predicted NBD/HSP70 family sugar kinase
MPQLSAPSAGRLLQLIRQGQARTRRDLMELTGLARSTIAARVDQLVSAGYLREGGVEASTGGRRPNVLLINEGSAVVLAAHLGATHGRVAVADLSGRALAESVGPVDIAAGPEETLRWAAQRFHALLAEAGRSMGEVCGVGIGLPCPIDKRSGRVVPTPTVPGWPEYDVVTALRGQLPGGQFPGPVIADNDANMMALGEYRAETAAAPGESALLLVKVGTGIGAGIVESGRVLHGGGGAAGEIGHVRLRGYDDVVCGCGSSGCLAAVASGAALARDLAAADPSVRDTADVVRLVAAGRPEAVRRVREAGRVLGQVLATVVSVVNPEILIVSGGLARTGDHLLAGVREVVYRDAQHRSTRGLRIAGGRLGEHAGVLGAAAMVADSVFSPEAVDARIASAESLRSTG